MEINNIFKADIQTNITSVIPTVVIDGDIFLSSKNFTKIFLRKIHGIKTLSEVLKALYTY